MSMEDYTRTEESENIEREVRKAKKKKMKHLKSFMHVFLGGLRHKDDGEPQQGKDITSTRDRQRDERDGLARAVAGGSSTPRGVDERGDGTRRRNSFPSPRHGAVQQQLPAPQLHLRGLYNHGNTCFMNAVLQCLSNTDQLAEYFVTDAYKGDFNKNSRPTGHLGTSTNVTEQFALLLKCLWSGQYNPVVSSRFKDVVGKSAEQYQGSAQHDAQEFFLWLLDNIHEDLNQAGNRRYKPLKNTAGRPDEEVAAEALASHMQRNNSFIQNLFQGQFRSALICPSCSTRSCTFDPYVSISLPLPQRETKPVYVTVVYRSTSRKMKVFGVNVSINSSIKELRSKLAELCVVNRRHLVLADLHPDGFHRTFYDDQHISVIYSNDLVFAFECPPYRGDNPEALTQTNPSGSKELILILVVNKIGQTHFGRRFGHPLILRVWRDLTHQQFQSVVLKNMAQFLREGIRLPEVCRNSSLFKCRVVDGLPGHCVLPTDADHPFYSPSIDKALNVSMLYGGPAHIKLVCEWEPETKAHVFGVIPDQVPEPHESVMELRRYYEQPLQTTLRDSLAIYTREETLNREDSWFCPHCRQQQQDATKKITLWTLPDVLVIHLKRFRQVGFSRMKLETLVNFPTTGLDMTPFLAPRSSGCVHSRPSSATPLSTSYKTQRAPAKSVHFEDEVGEVPKSPLGRSVSTGRGKGKRFTFPWKRQQSMPTDKRSRSDKQSDKKHSEGSSKKSAAYSRSRSLDRGQRRSRSPESSRRAYSPPAGSESPMSVRSAPSTVDRQQLQQPHHRYFLPLSPPNNLNGSRTSLDESRLNNVYDLFAVCNHTGTLSRGHYTAYCKNPADGRWYNFDDTTVQPITEDQLVTDKAYMLFYVRQSLMSSSPLSSSESSQSSSNSASHWIYHMPPFRLDLNDYHDELCHQQQQSHRQSQLSQTNSENHFTTGDVRPRTRLSSSNSVVSAPATMAISSRVSPPVSAQDVESFPSPGSGSVVPNYHYSSQDTHSDAFSAVSLPPYRGRGISAAPTYNQAVAYSGRGAHGTRHHSLRLGKGRENRGEWIEM
jgi:ubiquitin C-terminal hydrolase